MKVLKTDLTIYFDVDDTLVIWNQYKSYPTKCISITDPNNNEAIELLPNTPNIEFLKKCKGRKYFVTVWSQAGYAWAEAVVRKLELDKYVDEVRTKPLKYVDDIPCQEWMGQRINLPSGI